MRKGGSSRKGGAFERRICKELSLWWSDGKRDDIFWRTHASGGRATQRAKQGKQTKGQDCDIGATDPVGEPLLRWAVIECKDGYPGNCVCSLFDKTNLQQHPLYEQWFEKAAKERKRAKAKHFMVIARRKNKSVMVYLPYVAAVELSAYHRGAFDPELQLTFKRHKTGRSAVIVGTSWECFQDEVTPDNIRRIVCPSKKRR